MEKISRLNALLEAVRHSPQRIQKIFLQQDSGKIRVSEIAGEARAKGIPIQYVPRVKLDRIEKHHQGAIAFAAAKEYSSLEEILARSSCPFLVLLDGIEDPQNLGAIIRTAEGAGVDGVILPERRSASLTDAVASVSAGAVESVRVARVKNLAQSMELLKKKGIWLVGAEGGSRNLWFDFDYTLPVGLVLGSETKGLRPLIRRGCDAILSLPHLGRMTSLNVAAAASIFMYEVVRQRKISSQ